MKKYIFKNAAYRTQIDDFWFVKQIEKKKLTPSGCESAQLC